MNNDAGSVEQALSSGDVHELLRVWEDFNHDETWREGSATSSDQARVAAAKFLAEVREVAALEWLRANARAVELLTARRWYVIKSAREGRREVGPDRRSTGDHQTSCARLLPAQDRRAGKVPAGPSRRRSSPCSSGRSQRRLAGQGAEREGTSFTGPAPFPTLPYSASFTEPMLSAPYSDRGIDCKRLLMR